MEERLTTNDGREIAAWLLKADPSTYDAMAAFERFGVLTAWSVHPSDRADLMGAGQRVFLYGTAAVDGGVEPGIWGVGEVVGETYTAPGADVDGLWHDGDTGEALDHFVPIEVLRLTSTITRDALLAEAALAGSEVFQQPHEHNPNVVRPDELAALDGFDLSVVEPTHEQLERLAVEMEPDFALAVVDGTTHYAVVDDGDDDEQPWRVIRAEEGTDQEEVLSEHAELEEALASISGLLAEIGARAPIIDLDADLEGRELEPLAVVPIEEGGVYSVLRIGSDRFALYAPPEEGEEWQIDSEYPDLPSVIAELFAEDDVEA